MAQDYIDQWRLLAHISGSCAILGALVGLWGVIQAWLTLREGFGTPRTRTAKFLAWGDFLSLAALLLVALFQVATSVALLWLAGNYPAELGRVLATLDGGVTVAYLGYATQVALGTLGLAAYETARALATREIARNARRGRKATGIPDGS